jgi:putative PIN family toxin of toxin-antitoxin system
LAKPQVQGSDPIGPSQSEKRALVLDTNIILDLYVFNDPATIALRQAIEAGQLRWLATLSMREELERVLTYPQIVKSLAHHQTDAPAALAQFDAQSEKVAVAAKASVTCKDPDDQKFIDLAVAHQACLLSKDRAVLCMQKRLAALGVCAQSAMEVSPHAPPTHGLWAVHGLLPQRERICDCRRVSGSLPPEGAQFAFGRPCGKFE